jgi:hypothetical protein
MLPCARPARTPLFCQPDARILYPRYVLLKMIHIVVINAKMSTCAKANGHNERAGLAKNGECVGLCG